MAAPRARVEVAALQALLTGLGVLMALASRRVDRLRRQVTRDLVLEIRSDDGARRQYRLHAATRRLTVPRRRVQHAECTLIFPTAREGLRALLSPRAIGRIVEGMNTGATRVEGNAALLLWFHGLTRIVAPIGRSAGRAGRRRCRSAHPSAMRRGPSGSSASRRSPSSAEIGPRRGRRARGSCRSAPPRESGSRPDEHRRHRAQCARPRVASPPVGEGDDAG
jgi:hypothetical protein